MGSTGQSRSNTIESTENTDYGFLVIANGFGLKGRHREIELHVSTNGRSHLAVDRNTHKMIDCGNAEGVD